MSLFFSRTGRGRSPLGPLGEPHVSEHSLGQIHLQVHVDYSDWGEDELVTHDGE